MDYKTEYPCGNVVFFQILFKIWIKVVPDNDQIRFETQNFLIVYIAYCGNLGNFLYLFRIIRQTVYTDYIVSQTEMKQVFCYVWCQGYNFYGVYVVPVFLDLQFVQTFELDIPFNGFFDPDYIADGG